MARQKKPVHRVQMTEGKRSIIHQLLEEYDIQTAEDIQDALKDLLGGTIKEMMEAELDDHLGIKNRNAQTMMITGTVTNENGSTVVSVPWKSMCRKTENLPLNHRWSKNARKTFLILTRRSSPCMRRE